MVVWAQIFARVYTGRPHVWWLYGLRGARVCCLRATAGNGETAVRRKSAVATAPHAFTV